MAPAQLALSDIRNKQKREDVYRSRKRQATQDKLQRRLARAKGEADDPEAAKVQGSSCLLRCNLGSDLQLQTRREQNAPKTLDNTREHHPSMLADGFASTLVKSEDPAGPSGMSMEVSDELDHDLFPPSNDGPDLIPKILVTTSKRATRSTYEFCEDLTAVFPGAEFIRRKKGTGFELGQIAEWCGRRGYTALLVVNEDRKEPGSSALSCFFLAV